MPEHKIDVVGMNADGDELTVTRYSVEIGPKENEPGGYYAVVLQIDEMNGPRGNVETSRIYTWRPDQQPPKYVTWFLRRWLKTNEAEYLIHNALAHHDAWSEQRRAADREARADAMAFRRAAL